MCAASISFNFLCHFLNCAAISYHKLKILLFVDLRKKSLKKKINKIDSFHSADMEFNWTNSFVIIKCKAIGHSECLFYIANYKNNPKQNIVWRSHFNADGSVPSMSFSQWHIDWWWQVKVPIENNTMPFIIGKRECQHELQLLFEMYHKNTFYWMCRYVNTNCATSNWSRGKREHNKRNDSWKDESITQTMNHSTSERSRFDKTVVESIGFGRMITQAKSARKRKSQCE